MIYLLNFINCSEYPGYDDLPIKLYTLFCLKLVNFLFDLYAARGLVEEVCIHGCTINFLFDLYAARGLVEEVCIHGCTINFLFDLYAARGLVEEVCIHGCTMMASSVGRSLGCTDRHL